MYSMCGCYKWYGEYLVIKRGKMLRDLDLVLAQGDSVNVWSSGLVLLLSRLALNKLALFTNVLCIHTLHGGSGKNVFFVTYLC